MTAQRLRAVLTVTIDAEGDYYVDQADLVANVTPWIEGGLDDRDDICQVTITEQPPPVDRAAVLHDALATLRKIPVQCTGLTGPVWFGQGWKDALGELEELADYALGDALETEADTLRRRVLAVAEVIDANGIGWAADSIRRACEADEAQPAIGSCVAAETPQTETQSETQGEAPPREPHPTEADLRHALAVLDRFHGRDTATPAVVVEPGKGA